MKSIFIRGDGTYGANQGNQEDILYWKEISYMSK